jgi:hypothetical protein
MHTGRIKDSNRILGAPKGWDERRDGHIGVLYVREEITRHGPAMASAWFPTIEELRLLQAGAPVILSVMGEAHPPVAVGVGEPADAVRPMPRLLTLAGGNGSKIVELHFAKPVTMEQLVELQNALR